MQEERGRGEGGRGEGESPNSARTPASLSCQVDGRPPKYDLELLPGPGLMI